MNRSVALPGPIVRGRVSFATPPGSTWAYAASAPSTDADVTCRSAPCSQMTLWGLSSSMAISPVPEKRSLVGSISSAKAYPRGRTPAGSFPRGGCASSDTAGGRVALGGAAGRDPVVLQARRKESPKTSRREGMAIPRARKEQGGYDWYGTVFPGRQGPESGSGPCARGSAVLGPSRTIRFSSLL